jgi:hypothetical protein
MDGRLKESEELEVRSSELNIKGKTKEDELADWK